MNLQSSALQTFNFFIRCANSLKEATEGTEANIGNSDQLSLLPQFPLVQYVLVRP